MTDDDLLAVLQGVARLARSAVRTGGGLYNVARVWAASDVFPTPPDPDGLAEFLDQGVASW
ncbi:hypothetical protein ABZZ47_38125 [Streptomyces sp. NPDC006465]|uniref:hypothetical protein n=1 Tax=Streptomyces sp. NPDC006465 TaxID=3157174 RepID=UPI0033B45D54